MTKYNPSKHLPDLARAENTLSPSKLARAILDRWNEEIDPTAVTKWFTRHPAIYEQLQKEIVKGLPTEKEEIPPSAFQTENFVKLRSVADWILDLKTRKKGQTIYEEKAHRRYIEKLTSTLKRACRDHSTPKHPDRLLYRDVQEILAEREDRGEDTTQYRSALKDFLKFKGVSGWEKIAVGKARGFGKYKKLKLPVELVREMLGWIAVQDFEVYVVDDIMWHNGLRLEAVLTGQIEDFERLPDGWANWTVTEKFGKRPTFLLMPEVADNIERVIGDRKEGRIFQFGERRINELNRAALRKFVPDIEPKIRMPSHLYRHLCGQRLKELVGSDMAAAIMKTTKQSFEESYGADTDEEVEQWTREALPRLDPEE